MIRINNKTERILLALAVVVGLSFTGCQEPNSPTNMKIARQYFPNAAEISSLEIEGHSSEFPKFFQVNGPDGLLGYLVDHRVVSRSGPFTFSVLLDMGLNIKDVTVTSYTESRGREVRSPAFTGQFVGKGRDAEFKLGRDIDAITGATISSRVMTEGINEIVRIMRTNVQVTL